MPFTQYTTSSPLTADGTWQTLITGDNSGNSAPAHYSLSIFPETFYKGDKIRVLVETFDENDSTWHYYLGKELGYEDIRYPTKFIDADNSFIDAGIIARWQFNSNLEDSVGNEDLTLGAGTTTYSTSDKKEGSASSTYNGSTYHLTTNNEPFDFEYTDAFSISFWFKTNVAATDMFVSKQESSGTFRGYSIFHASGIIRVQIINDNGTSNKIQFDAGTTAYNDNLWHHVVLTKSTATTLSGCKIYIDGLEITKTSTTDALSGTILNAKSLNIGARNGTTIYSGSMDDVIIYSYELSSNQVKEIYNSYQGLVTHINFDNQVEDQFGSNDGTWTGTAIYGVGKIDRSGFFDGSSYITLANESNFDFEYNQPFSISGWIKTTTTGATDGIVMKSNDTTTGVGYGCYVDSGDNFLHFKIADGTTSFDIASTSSVKSGSWVHFACTKSTDANRSGMKIYINGALETTGSSSAISTTILNAVSVIIGAESDAGNPFTGQLDDIKIWNKELNAEEVTREYGTKLGEIFNVFLPKQKFRVKLQQYKGHFRNYDYILYEVS